MSVTAAQEKVGERQLTVEAYVEKAKGELDAFAARWNRQRKQAPNIYPDVLEEGEWGEQELAARFGQW